MSEDRAGGTEALEYEPLRFYHLDHHYFDQYGARRLLRLFGRITPHGAYGFQLDLRLYTRSHDGEEWQEESKTKENRPPRWMLLRLVNKMVEDARLLGWPRIEGKDHWRRVRWK